MFVFLTQQINLFFQQNFYWQSLSIFFAVYAIWVLVIGYLLIIFYKRFSWRHLFMTVMIIGLVYAIDFIIGYIWFESRPYVLGVSRLLIDAPTFNKSFPSDHAAVAMVICLGFRRLNKNWWPLVIIALLIALGRVAVGVHYFHDVLVGLLIGWVVTLLVEKFFDNSITSFHLSNNKL